MNSKSPANTLVDEALRAVLWILVGAILALGTIYPVSLRLILDEVEVNCTKDGEQYESEHVVIYVSFSGQVKRVKCK